MTRPDSATQLLALLQTEETAILSGDYADLAPMAEAKIALSGQIETDQADEATLQRISRRAQRNSSLLRAATAGIDDARKIINRLKTSAITEVYDRNGTRHPMPAPHSGLERKF